MFEKLKKWREENSILIDLIFILLFSFTCVICLVAIVQYNSCQVYSNMGVDAQYNFWTGCMANHPKFGWVPIEKYFEILNLNIQQ